MKFINKLNQILQSLLKADRMRRRVILWGLYLLVSLISYALSLALGMPASLSVLTGAGTHLDFIQALLFLVIAGHSLFVMPILVLARCLCFLFQFVGDRFQAGRALKN